MPCTSAEVRSTSAQDPAYRPAHPLHLRVTWRVVQQRTGQADAASGDPPRLFAIIWAVAAEVNKGPAFTLEYDMQPEDVREAVAATPRLKKWRILTVVGLILWGLYAVGFTAITIRLNHRSAVNGSAGAPSWIYVVDIVLWLITAFMVRAVWLRNPRRLAQSVIDKTPEFQGRTRDQVEAGGIRVVSANGTEIYYPWSAIDRVEETTRALLLLDRNGRILVVLPKRGLDSPDLLPALRIYLKQALA